MDKFIKRGSVLDETIKNTTLPMPVTCKKCGYELPDDKPNKGEFVNQLTCLDLNRNSRKITGVPSTFMEKVTKDKKETCEGSSSSGYTLKPNFKFYEWHVFCEPCYVEMCRLQDMSRKVNHLRPDGKAQALSIQQALIKLRSHQNMRSQ